MRKALYILADLDDQDLLWLVKAGSYESHRAGTVLIEAGGKVDSLYIVIEGELDVILPPRKVIGDMGTGDLIGEMSLIEKRPPSATVAVTSDAKLLAIPHAIMRERLQRDTGFAARFYHALAVLLSDRMRTRVARAAYGSDQSENAGEVFERENELDENLLDNLHVAGDRMGRLIRLLEGGDADLQGH